MIWQISQVRIHMLKQLVIHMEKKNEADLYFTWKLISTSIPVPFPPCATKQAAIFHMPQRCNCSMNPGSQVSRSFDTNVNQDSSCATIKQVDFILSCLSGQQTSFEQGQIVSKRFWFCPSISQFNLFMQLAKGSLGEFGVEETEDRELAKYAIMAGTSIF